MEKSLFERVVGPGEHLPSYKRGISLPFLGFLYKNHRVDINFISPFCLLSLHVSHSDFVNSTPTKKLRCVHLFHVARWSNKLSQCSGSANIRKFVCSFPQE
mmetsp:Transcript_6528/g.24523  ORF Transcript_6528/g.24523 Transcript_6528/m.24523 type:complete len:101 (-) Transcript_6528:10342-10644(-)